MDKICSQNLLQHCVIQYINGQSVISSIFEFENYIKSARLRLKAETKYLLFPTLWRKLILLHCFATVRTLHKIRAAHLLILLFCHILNFVKKCARLVCRRLTLRLAVHIQLISHFYLLFSSSYDTYSAYSTLIKLIRCIQLLSALLRVLSSY